MGLVNSKSEAGLCPNCYRYRTEAWERLEVYVKLSWSTLSPILSECKLWTKSTPLAFTSIGEVYSEGALPWVEEIDFVIDAGSVYKLPQTLLGLRNIKEEVTGIRVRYVHFNASGEGKRWETDGHNTDIKVRREHAMRAGQPFACNTPASDVEKKLSWWDWGVISNLVRVQLQERGWGWHVRNNNFNLLFSY
jgi:hypothetical protein